jgi:S1/P1 Nuclease
MKRSVVGPFLAILVVGVTAGPSFAWHDRGHMTVALIAFRQMNDEQKKKVVNILKEHPHYGEFLSAGKPADAGLDEWVVMQAAVWPDWVRHHHLDDGFNQPFHHYVNLPIKRLEGASAQQLEEINRNIDELPSNPSSGQLLKEYPNRLSDVRNNTTEAKKRAIALCWIFHLTGDIHQPLHAATLFTKRSRGGDHGGNAAFVPWNGHAENLHSIWDGVVGWDEFAGLSMTRFGVVDLMARDFQSRYTFTAVERAVAKVDDWAAESRDLAVTEVYSFNGTPLAIVFSFDQHPHLNVTHMTPLPDGYRDRARGVAEKRVTLAGLRLVDLIKDLP